MSERSARARATLDANRWVAIVDDDSSVRTALARALRIQGLRVGTFCCAHEYLAATDSDGAPCCLILDVYLGPNGMTGLELYDFLRAKGAKVPVILMTAHDEVPSWDLARRAGAECYLRKPFECAALISLVDRALGAKR